MAIVKMKRLRLLAMQSDREALLHLLQRMGCVEIDEPSVDRADQVWAGLIHPDTQALAAAREERSAQQHALEVLKRYAPVKGKLLQARPALTQQQLYDQQDCEAAKKAAQEINRADRALAALRAEQGKLTAQRAALAPWLELDVPLDTPSTPEVLVQFGTVPVGTKLEELRGALEAASPLVELTQASEDRESRYCLLVCHRSAEQALQEILRDCGWSRSALRDYTGTARENSRRIDQALERTAQEIAGEEKLLSGMGGSTRPLQRALDRSDIEIEREQARARLLDTQQTFFLEGWVPGENWPKAEAALAAYPCAWEVEDPTEEEYPQVPVLLKNNWLTRPLNMVTEMYSLPAYGSLDPNPLMAPFFILFYGIMMADMGYGLLMMLASVVVLNKMKPKGTMNHFFSLLGLCGVSTFLVGALTGGFFGDFIPQLVKVLNPESTFVWFWTPLFTPLDDTMAILIGAMCLGFVQIVTGMAISFFRKLRDGQVMDAIWEEVTWWVVFAGLALAVLGKTSIVLAVGGVMVLVGSGWNAKGFGKVTAIFGSLYNHVTGYFGDILSYARLMALMLAGSVIAQVFNTLGAIPGNVIIFIVISMAGNTLNFALNLLGCYVHDLRLQCLEYFGKFYQDGGRAFKPMSMKTKFVDIAD